MEGRAARDVIRENIRVTNEALRSRVGIAANGFRTPGGFQNGLDDRVDLQELLLELGFRWVSSKYPAHPMGPPKTAPTQEIYDGIVAAQAQAQPYRYANGLVELPMSPVSDVGAFRTNYWKLEYFLKAIRLAVNWAIENRGVHVTCASILSGGRGPPIRIDPVDLRTGKELGGSLVSSGWMSSPPSGWRDRSQIGYPGGILQFKQRYPFRSCNDETSCSGVQFRLDRAGRADL